MAPWLKWFSRLCGKTVHPAPPDARVCAALEEAAAARREVEALQAENQRIVNEVRAKNRFLAELSHELRSPLNAVIGFAELLRSGAVPHESPQHANFLTHIENGGRRLLQLINDVLELSRIDTGRVVFSLSTVNLQRLIEDTLGLLPARLRTRQVAIDIEVAPGLDAIVTDEARLKQAMLPLVQNAVRASPTGTRIVVRARASGDARFRLEVQDRGAPMADADLDEAFAEFPRHGTAGAGADGAGLSLALTRRLVEAQGGAVGVQRLPDGNLYHLELDRVARALTGRPEAVRHGMRG